MTAPWEAGAAPTFGIVGGKEARERFIHCARFMSHPANVGDAKTLIVHPAPTTHRQLDEEQQRAAGVSPDMIRLSVGIENIEDILADLDQAIERATGKVSVGTAG